MTTDSDTIYYTYDALGRRITETDADGSGDSDSHGRGGSGGTGSNGSAGVLSTHSGSHPLDDGYGDSGTTTDLYYSSAGQVVEEQQSGVTTTQYVWSPFYVNQMIERDDHDPATSGTLLNRRLYPTYDADYNITSLTNGSSSEGTLGAVVERYEYDPDGNVTVLNPTGTTLSSGTITASNYAWRYTFQSGRIDLVTGLIRFGARDYDPGTSTWKEQDPSGAAGSGVNLYLAENSNPVESADPTGLAGFDLGAFLKNIPNAADGLVRNSVGAAGSVINAPIQLGGQVVKDIGGATGQVAGLFNQDAGQCINSAGNTVGGAVQTGGNAIKSVVDTGGNVSGNAVKGTLATGGAVGGLVLSDVLATGGAYTEDGIFNMAGQIWGSPNTALGLALGLAGVIGGGELPYVGDDNAIDFPENPILNLITPHNPAITFGNVQLYGDANTNPYFPLGVRPRGVKGFSYVQPDGTQCPLNNIEDHEGGHTQQSQLFGPFFIPAYIIAQLAAGGNPNNNQFEIDADQRAFQIEGTEK